MIDTHTHLYLPEFADNDAAGPVNAVDRAVSAGVSRMIMPNVGLDTVAPLLALHEARPEVTSIAMGLHPTEVADGWREDMARMRELLDSSPEPVAIGEVGIDLYWDKSFEREQMIVLEEQLGWACGRNLPVIIHCREGLEQTLEVLQEFRDLHGVMHSFGGTPADVDAVRRVVDFHFGINGIVTFKNSKLRDTLPTIGIDRLLLETDSPYLAPVPMRGKRNESSYLVHVNGYIALAMGLDAAETDRITTRNAQLLFNL